MVFINPACKLPGVTWLLLACLSLGCEMGESGRTSLVATIKASDEKIEAVILDARQAPSDSVLQAIGRLGAGHIALVSFGFQSGPNDPSIRFSPDVHWFTESSTGVRDLTARASELGMRIILKPQLWLRGGMWTADIDFETEEDWRKWEDDYRRYLLHTAGMAEDIGADLLIIGTELGNPVRERPQFWRALIGDVRKIYGGKLTYGANWHDDYEHVAFWDSLDYIGVQAYFPISKNEAPSSADLQSGWRAHVKNLESIAAREDLPILFTEIGYRSVHYAAGEPWRWPSRDESAQPDLRLQEDLFSAFFESIWQKPWFSGAIIWKFHGDGHHRWSMLDFTPQGKPAEEVIRRWFEGG